MTPEVAVNAIAVNGLRKAYQGPAGTVRAIDGVDMTVSRGEFVAAMGPSGCGKSTLLHLLGGLERPDDGDIVVSGISLHQMNAARLARFRRKQVGFVFQFFNLLPVLTAKENISLPLQLASGRSHRHDARVQHLLERVGMSARGNMLPSELSGGEQQRVAIARALVNQPDVVLADEPTGNLDHANTELVLQLFADINQVGQTVLVMTHDPLVASHAKRVLFMRDGRIVDAVTPSKRGDVRAILARVTPP